jgi:hypothetical protein
MTPALQLKTMLPSQPLLAAEHSNVDESPLAI